MPPPQDHAVWGDPLVHHFRRDAPGSNDHPRFPAFSGCASLPSRARHDAVRDAVMNGVSKIPPDDGILDPW
jgi:hypothetical protein